MKNLYKITVQRGDHFFVIAEDSTEAYNRLREKLDKEGWWFLQDRRLSLIELVASTGDESPGYLLIA